MKEYIDREALLEPLSKQLDYLRKKYGDYDHYTDGYSDAYDTVEDFPVADVVEVVRCKDCRFNIFVQPGGIIHCKARKDEHTHFRKPNDFCSYGERKGQK